MYAHLEHANLLGARLECADARFARFNRSRLELAGLDQANLRGATGVLFNCNRADRIEIEGDTPDPWSVLRRAYTGPRFFVHLFLLVLFFAPYAIRTAYLTLESRIQTQTFEQLDEIGRHARRLPTVQRTRTFDEIMSVRARVERGFFDSHVSRPAAWVVIGGARGWRPLGLAIVVILYNAIRAYLTLRVSILRDAEERSGITPALDEYHGKCHPLNKDGDRLHHVPRVWWKGHGEWLWLARPPWLSERVCSAMIWPLARIRPRLVKSIEGASRPPSFIQCLGLFRLHRFASVLVWIALCAIAYNTVLWIGDTRLWVPLGP